MNAETVARVMSLIPERVGRVPSGACLDGASVVTRHPERIALLGQFMHWLAPLAALSKDDQRVLGLLNAQGRPMHAADADADEELDAEAALAGGEAGLELEAVPEPEPEAEEEAAEAIAAGTPIAALEPSAHPLEVSHA